MQYMLIYIPGFDLVDASGTSSPPPTATVSVDNQKCPQTLPHIPYWSWGGWANPPHPSPCDEPLCWDIVEPT